MRGGPLISMPGGGGNGGMPMCPIGGRCINGRGIPPGGGSSGGNSWVSLAFSTSAKLKKSGAAGRAEITKEKCYNI